MIEREHPATVSHPVASRQEVTSFVSSYSREEYLSTSHRLGNSDLERPTARSPG